VVNVSGSSELVRTDTPTVSQTINSDFIQTLPRVDRNALELSDFPPGVPAGWRRGETMVARAMPPWSACRSGRVNITIDGVTNSNLLQSGDGFFSLVVPRLDAVEEVTLTTASAGADASGQGAVQIRFVTRSGTNKLEASPLLVSSSTRA
jgi:outer membrane receptor protein involved in Fe transport